MPDGVVRRELGIRGAELRRDEEKDRCVGVRGPHRRHARCLERSGDCNRGWMVGEDAPAVRGEDRGERALERRSRGGLVLRVGERGPFQPSPPRVMGWILPRLRHIRKAGSFCHREFRSIAVRVIGRR